MTNVEDLQERSKEILDYAKEQGFNVFYCKELPVMESFIEANWDNFDDWKEFFNIARKEDVKTILVTIRIFEEKDMPNTEEAVDESDREEGYVDFRKFSSYVGKVGSYEFTWVKNGTKFSISETTDCYQDYLALVEGEIKSVLGRRASGGMAAYGASLRDHGTKQFLKSLNSKPEEETSKEIVEFVRKEGGSQDWTRHYNAYELIRLY
ncbi:MAG: hypothetical protein ACREAG_00965 [Nitrosopumilaceae archaeon]